MQRFFHNPRFSRNYYSEQSFFIYNAGYNDYQFIKPCYLFRTQPSFTWHIILSGSGTLEIYGKNHTLKAGDMFFIPPDTKMRYFPNEADPWEYFWFASNGEEMSDLAEMAGFGRKKPVMSAKKFSKIKKTLSELLGIIRHKENGIFAVMSAFYEIMDLCSPNNPAPELEQAKLILDEGFASPNFRIEQLCYDVGISHAHLLRLFKQEYGVTLTKYIQKKRLDLACELLSTTNLPVNSVGSSCGFSDVAHFMKSFKNEFGITALSYRQKYNASPSSKDPE